MLHKFRVFCEADRAPVFVSMKFQAGHVAIVRDTHRFASRNVIFAGNFHVARVVNVVVN